MAKPNYNYEKRQRELKKNRKQEEKRLKKLERKSGADSAPDSEGAPEAARTQD